MTLTIHHYFPFGSNNIGDQLVARAIRQAITRHFGPCHFVDMPVNDCYRLADRPIGLMGTNIDRSNAEADLVVVGGSNLLEPRRLRRSRLHRPQWGVFTDESSLARLRTPLLLIGMGTGSDFGSAIPPYGEAAAAQIRALHQKAFASAVRDQTTVDRLAEIGVRTVCTGCPVTFLTDAPVTNENAKLPLIVSFPPGRILRKLVGRTAGWHFMNGAVRYIGWLKSLGVPFVVTLHESDDVSVASEWLPKDIEVFHTQQLDELIARYQSSRAVIGFRLHAALLALGLGTPIVPASVDWRGRAFVETFGLQRMAITPFRFGQFRKLRMWTEKLLAGDANMIETLDRSKSLFRPRYHEFLSDAAARFTPPARPR